MPETRSIVSIAVSNNTERVRARVNNQRITDPKKVNAENCANSILEEFHKVYGKPENATGIVLESCEAVADTLFSLADIRRTDQMWRLDYMSLREDPLGPYLPMGTTSA